MTFIPPKKHTAAINGLPLSYYEWHPGGEPVLLLHGLADHGLVWASLGESLGEKYHVVALDLRGHGDSGKPETGYTFADYNADLDGICQHFGWSKVNLLGHSWGAKIATVWATQNPEKVKSLILADPFFMGQLPLWWRYTFPIGYRVLPFLKLLGQFESYHQAEAIAKKLKQYRGWNEWQQAICRESFLENPDGTWTSKFVKRACDEIFLDILRVNGLTQPLGMPSLFVRPEGGLNRLEFQLKPYRQYLTNLQWQKVPGNHWAHMVEPEPFNQAIANFLTRSL
ncbi:alpha/beta fold hydrolase [Picosynechococcus sp. PCC 8807]|uniref:alpha/beta fold hydrolase n=1 Tax=Picosynechococcus sp. PCC 8807 TaxID=195248 RepID=UPI000810C993|nr:alpha/beta hydrolase [Picosynechococcus sp. PCC 8807]ANV90548.1 haloalkane dehalogenase [Picosynechococcus sp. PCC 8807]